MAVVQASRAWLHTHVWDFLSQHQLLHTVRGLSSPGPPSPELPPIPLEHPSALSHALRAPISIFFCWKSHP